MAETKTTSDCETVIHISATANCTKIKFVLVKPNSDVEVLKEIISQENNRFVGNTPILCQKDTNTIKAVGSGYNVEFKISQDKSMIFECSTSRMGKDFPFRKGQVPIELDM